MECRTAAVELNEDPTLGDVHGIRHALSALGLPFVERADLVDATMPTRPDGYYGLSKVFGEQIARYYWDRFGVETVCIRFGYCWPEATTYRQMALWLSLDDLVRLLHCSLITPRVGHTIAFGVSNNPGRWWDDRHAAFLCYQPKDSSERFADKLPDAVAYPPADDIATIFQGGAFLNNGPKYRP